MNEQNEKNNPESGDEENPDVQNFDDLEADQAAAEDYIDEAAIGGTISEIDRIAELEEELGKMKDQAMRALAEAENTRRRAQAEIQSKLKYANTDLARDLLAVADNLTRALEAVDPESRKADEALENLCVGVEMTQKQLHDAFAKAGVKPIEALNQRFDHNYHQAMFEIPNPEVPSGTVLQEMQRGYVIHDRLLRPAMVGVAKGGPKPEAPASSDGEEAAAKAQGGAAYSQGGDGAGGNYDSET